jgi:hypothetical protein
MKEFSMQLTRRSSAPPEAIYDSLADLGTHTTWGGTKQLYNFRLRSLEAPAGPASEGTSFTSTGTIPMSMRRFEDHSNVTVAQRPHAFEFVTNSAVRRGKRPMAATYRHRYEIAATPEGSDITYTMTQLRATNPFLRLSLPGIRTMSWRVGIPFMSGRGFRNLLAEAERGANVESASELASQVNL